MLTFKKIKNRFLFIVRPIFQPTLVYIHRESLGMFLEINVFPLLDSEKNMVLISV